MTAGAVPGVLVLDKLPLPEGVHNTGLGRVWVQHLRSTAGGRQRVLLCDRPKPSKGEGGRAKRVTSGGSQGLGRAPRRVRVARGVRVP